MAEKKKRARNDAGHLYQRTPRGFWYGRWWSGPENARVRKKARLHRDKREAQKLLDKLIAKEKAIDAGIIARPKTGRQEHALSTVVDEYLEWGASAGGLRGRPWSAETLRKKEQRLSWWREELGFEFVSELAGSLSLVEESLRGLFREEKDDGTVIERTGKTVQNYAEALASFCDWCARREFLETDPLKDLGKIDTTPAVTRRALTVEELQALLAVAPPKRRLTYQVAVCTGLRAGELEELTVAHLDSERGGLKLDAAWTKNRKPGFQPLPSAILDSLKEKARSKSPTDPLLYVGSNMSRDIDSDCAKAGIEKTTSEGKVDFHALRSAFTTLVIESGANVKETQELVRHSTPQLTMDIYARARNERLANVVEQVGAVVLQTGRNTPPNGTRGEPSGMRVGPPVGPSETNDEDDGDVSDSDADCLARVTTHPARGFDSPRLHHLMIDGSPSRRFGWDFFVGG